MNKSTRKWIYLVLAVLLVVLLIRFLPSGKGKEVGYVGEGGLVELVKEGKVSDIYVNGSYKVYIRFTGSEIPEKKFPSAYDAFCYVPDRNLDALMDAISASGVAAPKITYNDPNRYAMLISVGIPILGTILALVVLYIIMKRNSARDNQALSFGKTKARVNANVKVRFSDVAGAEEEKEELQEIVEFLKNPKKFTEMGARIPKGVLLVGPPGTGKTLFAKAVAGEANVPFFNISGSDFVEMFVGVGASRVRDLFDQAKRNMPCIVFIDEIDAVGRQRGAGLGGGNDEREQTLNQLLVQMDGFEKNEGIIIMAATNRPDILDQALLRPGRFDRQIYVHIPDVKGREAIFRVHSRNKPLAPDIDFKALARLTGGFSGADIENLLNEAAILAARNNRTAIIMDDINEAINKVIAGPQKKSRVVTETDKRITAYHESGHAIVAKLLKHCDAVHEVSIIARGQAAGYTITLPENDNNHVTKNKLLDTITMMLGGRAAEEIVIQDVSTGASNDIERATGVAKRMVTEWGMSELGTMFLGADKEVFLGRDYGTSHSYSEEMASKIDGQVQKIISACYDRAKQILLDNRAILDTMVRLLYAKNTIFEDEVNMIFEGKTYQEILDKMAETEEKIKSDYTKKSTPSEGSVEEKQPAAAPAEPVEKPAEQAEEQAETKTDEGTDDTTEK
ncbi:MAG: ATP-dependent zinc metalloprotease FtsH [Eubacteriales bacterium]|nr:ATP-dependent zinc metalloprotease FtsH [Eubacteriales bacterium]